MRSWLFKTALQRFISTLPRSEWWNELLQRYVTGGLQLQPYGEFQSKLKACRRHFDYYRAFSRKPFEEFRVVEIGTGWFPIIPIGLYLCGAREIWTFDIVRLLRADTFKKVIECFCLFAKTGELYQILPAARPEFVSKLLEQASLVAKMSPVDFLNRLNIHSLVRDVRRSGLENGCADLVLSNGVFELLQPESLPQTLTELRRLSSETSVMSNYVCIADQFATFDRSITPFNNLKYSTRAWGWLKSPLVPQTRLRISDYRQACTEAGFEIVGGEDIHGSESDLASIKLAPEFEHYSKDDLLVLYSWLIARPAVGAIGESRGPDRLKVRQHSLQ